MRIARIRIVLGLGHYNRNDDNNDNDDHSYNTAPDSLSPIPRIPPRHAGLKVSHISAVSGELDFLVSGWRIAWLEMRIHLEATKF